jgi:hypothetical protein
MLDDADFKVDLPEHVITLPQHLCCLYCTWPMAESLWVDKLIARLAKEKSPAAARSILSCLHDSVTEKAQKAIQEFATSTKDKQLAEGAARLAKFTSRADLPAIQVTAKRELLFRFLDDLVARRDEETAYDPDEYEKQAPYLVIKADFARLHELRRKQAARVSDEALEEIAYLTRLMELSFTSTK